MSKQASGHASQRQEAYKIPMAYDYNFLRIARRVA